MSDNSCQDQEECISRLKGVLAASSNFPRDVACIESCLDDLEKTQTFRTRVEENGLQCFSSFENASDAPLVYGFNMKVTNKEPVDVTLCEGSMQSHQTWIRWPDGCRTTDFGESVRFFIPIVVETRNFQQLGEKLLVDCASQFHCKGPDLDFFKFIVKLMHRIVTGKVLAGCTFLTCEFRVYFSLHRLLLYILEEGEYRDQCREYLEYMTSNFQRDPEVRGRHSIKDIGEFIILVMLSNQCWGDLGQFVIQEAFVRQVYHYERSDKTLQPNRNVTPEAIFKASKEGLRIVALHVHFAETGANITTLKMDEQAGLPTCEELETANAMYTYIMEDMTTHEDFFRIVGVKLLVPVEDYLRSARSTHHENIRALKRMRQQETSPGMAVQSSTYAPRVSCERREKYDERHRQYNEPSDRRRQRYEHDYAGW